MKSVSTFPFRIFRWFLWRQILFLSFSFAVLGAALWLWVETRADVESALDLGRLTVAVTLFSVFCAMVLISVVMARRLMIPLARLIEKTKRMHEFPLEDVNTAASELPFDKPSEWFEMEQALNQLGHDLRNKTIRLSREKTELRAIMSAVSEAVLAISIDKRILFYNPQFAVLFNMAQAPEPGTRIGEILRSNEVLEAYDSALATGMTERREVQVPVSSERLPRHFQLSVAPLMKKHNREIYGAVGILHDITELKRAENIRIEFVGNVSHELRSPLTAINGYLQTLVGDFETGQLDQAKDFLRIVSHNVTRLKSLVEDLLDLSALESGKELNLDTVNVREITEGVMRQLDIQDHTIRIGYEIDEMFADGDRLEQVLRNLLENAVRYVPKGKNVDINWRRRSDGTIGLHVKDDGPGIAVQHQARLFERFYRVDESRSRAQGGTGIGLSLVKHIMQRHGGQVSVHSEPGRGAEFICEFPGN